jgi:hypothetical protein
MAWFAIVFTGRYPEGLYDFNAGVLRFIARANAFMNLQTDEWPPFGFEEASEYPIRATVGPPLERYNRWKTGFRFILGIPAIFVLYLIGSYFTLSAPRHGLLSPDDRDAPADLAAGTAHRRLTG